VLLGVVSLLNDLSSDMILAVLPMFIASIGGAGVAVGLVGGIESSMKSLLSVFAGHLSDGARRRKPIVAAGYGISAVFKMLLPLATIWPHVLVLKIGERFGKGIRQAPRDAMIAEALPVGRRGLGFGFHRAMDTAGALLGSLVGLGLFWFMGLELRAIMIVGGVLAFLSLAPLAAVREQPREPLRTGLGISVKGLSRAYYVNVALVSLFALSRLSYMLFLLRVHDAYSDRLAVGVPLAMYVVYNATPTLFSVPAGWLSDRLGRRPVLIMGYVLFTLVCAGFVWASCFWAWAVLFALYGLTHALTEGNQRALAADLCGQERKGTAMGVFHAATGISGLAGSIIGGVLWTTISPSAAFVYGAALSAAAAAGFLLLPGAGRR